MTRHRLIAFIIPSLIALACCGLWFMYPDTTALQNAPTEDLWISARQEQPMTHHPIKPALDDEEQAQLRDWLRSLKWLSITYATYAPELELRGDGFCVNFQRNRTIINYRKAPGEHMTQVSRAATDQDRKIAELLQRKATPQ